MIKFLRFKLEILVAYLKKNFLILGFGATLGSVLFLNQNLILTFFRNQIRQTQYIGIEGLYTTQNLPEQITSLISYGLTLHTDNHKPQISPIVQSLDLQNDNKDYLFTLKNNIRWHNGKKLTAADLDYQISGLTIATPSPNQLKISVQDQFSPLLSALSQALFQKNLVGLGPFKVQKITFQEGFVKSIKLRPVDSNHKKNLVFRFYRNEKELINAYKLGQVDQIEISYLPEEFESWTNTDIDQQVMVDQRYTAVFLNTRKLKSKQLRQALAYATPKTKDKNERCLGPISPNSWAYNLDVKVYPQNPQRAKELFEQNQSDPPLTKINLSVHDRRLLGLAEQIKTAWADILGLDTTIAIENQIDKQNFDTVIAFGGIPHDPDQYSFWHSTQTNTNLTQLNDPRIDNLLEEGRQTFDPQERRKIYLEFQKFLLEESPAIFLTYPTTYTIKRTK